MKCGSGEGDLGDRFESPTFPIKSSSLSRAPTVVSAAESRFPPVPAKGGVWEAGRRGRGREGNLKVAIGNGLAKGRRRRVGGGIRSRGTLYDVFVLMGIVEAGIGLSRKMGI